MLEIEECALTRNLGMEQTQGVIWQKFLVELPGCLKILELVDSVPLRLGELVVYLVLHLVARWVRHSIPRSSRRACMLYTVHRLEELEVSPLAVWVTLRRVVLEPLLC